MPLSSHAALQKADQILEACKEGDVDAVVEFAVTEGGLVNDEVRRKACELCSSVT